MVAGKLSKAITLDFSFAIFIVTKNHTYTEVHVWVRDKGSKVPSAETQDSSDRGLADAEETIAATPLVDVVVQVGVALAGVLVQEADKPMAVEPHNRT